MKLTLTDGCYIPLLYCVKKKIQFIICKAESFVFGNVLIFVRLSRLTVLAPLRATEKTYFHEIGLKCRTKYCIYL